MQYYEFDRLFNSAQRLLMHGKYDLATAEYLKCIEIDPTSFLSYFGLALTYLALDNYDEARKNINNALELSSTQYKNELLSKWASNLHKKGWEYMDVKENDKAANLFNEAIKYFPGHVDSHIDLGVCKGRMGDYKGAIKCEETAIRYDANNATAHFNLGWDLKCLGNYLEASTNFEKAIELDPNIEASKNFVLAENYFELAKKAVSDNLGNVALGFLNKAIFSHYEAYPEAIKLRADVYKSMGKSYNALCDYLDYAYMYPDSGVAQYEVALIYSQLNEYKLAIMHLKKANKLGCSDANKLAIEIQSKYKAQKQFKFFYKIDKRYKELFQKPFNQDLCQQLPQNPVERSKVLRWAIKKRNIDIRLRGLQYAKFFADYRITGELMKCLNSKHGSVKSAAKDAIINLCDPKAFNMLFENLDFNDDNVYDCIPKAIANLDEYAETLIYTLDVNKYEGEVHEKYRRSVLIAYKYLNTPKYTSAILSTMRFGIVNDDKAMHDYAKDAILNLKMPRIGHLIENLSDWIVGPFCLKLLEKKGWCPVKKNDKIHAWVASRNGFNLKNDWENTKSILLNDVLSGDYSKIQNALYAFIGIGYGSIIDDLKNALGSHGNKEMAEAYLNCGNKELEDTARNWAYSHGFVINKGAGASPVRWGQL